MNKNLKKKKKRKKKIHKSQKSIKMLATAIAKETVPMEHDFLSCVDEAPPVKGVTVGRPVVEGLKVVRLGGKDVTENDV